MRFVQLAISRLDEGFCLAIPVQSLGLETLDKENRGSLTSQASNSSRPI